MKGKLIVIEGIDGSGKHTQVEALKKHFVKKGFKVKTIAFPRYDQFFGKLALQLLQGKLGEFSRISPYLGALPYALDRREARDEIVNWLKKGYLVLADRYVSASLAHQAAKLPVPKQRQFVDWLIKVEYTINALPKEDLVLVLDVKPSASRRRLWGEKTTDQAEKSLNYQKRSRQVYRALAKRFKHWKIVSGVGTIETVTKRLLGVIKIKA